MNVHRIGKILYVLLLATTVISGWGCYDARSARLKGSPDMGLDVQTWNCGASGSNVTATLKGDGTLIVRGVGVMENYDDADRHLAPWHDVKGRITGVVIEDGVTTIGMYAFMDCTALEVVTIPSSVTTIGTYAFSNCIGLTSVTIPGSVRSIEYCAFADCIGLTSVTIEDGVKRIGVHAFAGCTSLASVVIPSSVTSIGSYAFGNCTSLTSVMISSSVTTIGDGAFARCTSLASVVIPGSVTSIGKGSHAFYGCIRLTSIIVATDNARYSSEDGVLFNKTKDTLILHPKNRQGAYAVPRSVKFIGYEAFIGTSLTSVIIPGSVASIGGRAFAFSNVTSVTIESGVESIEDEAFADCSLLTSVTIPGTMASIGRSVFAGCTGLATATIEDGVASIEYAMFSHTRLTSVAIPSSVKTIGPWAFFDCVGLTSVNILNPAPPDIVDGTFGRIPSNACLNVPESALAAYSTAEGWRDFKCIKPLAPAPDDASGR